MIETDAKTRKEVVTKYDTFIRSGLAAGFTDDQIDWLWEHLSTFKDNHFLDEAAVENSNMIQ